MPRLPQAEVGHRQYGVRELAAAINEVVPGDLAHNAIENSISTPELSRQIGVERDTAWRLRQKLASVIGKDEARRSFQGPIEMDDAVLGAEKSEAEGGKRGRGGANKVPFVVAVETTAEGDHAAYSSISSNAMTALRPRRWPVRN